MQAKQPLGELCTERWQDDRCGHDRPSPGAAAGFIDAGYMADAMLLKVCF